MTVTARAIGLLSVLAFTALFSSACLWGIVRDANTGAPIGGASVSFRDALGSTGEAVTNSDGWYVFDGIQGGVPAEGMVDFTVTATGYRTLEVQRDVAYGDNAGGALSAQAFELVMSDYPLPNPPSGG